MNNDLTVLIVGFSKDRDVIPIQEFFFNHFWADCPFKKIFSIDDTTRFLNFESVSTEGNPSFAKRLRAGLSLVNSKYVLLLLGDYWLSDRPRSNYLLECCSFMDRFEGDFMQLGTQMECKLRGKKIKSTNFCKLSRNKHYRINLQQAIWRKSSLDKVLDAANIYSTWDFEVFFIDDSYGQKLSRGFNAFFPKGYTFPIVNGMEKGIISYPAIELLDRFGRAYPPTRQIQTKQEYRKKHRYDCLHAVTPRFLRLFLKKVMKICGTKFLSKG